MKTLYVVRHGITKENNQRIHQPEDTSLSKEGEEQALVLQRRLAEIPLEVVYTSPLPRAKKTTEIVNKALQLPTKEDDFLKEWKNPTSLVGKSLYGEESRKFTKAKFVNRADPNWKWEDEETIKEAKDRVGKFFKKMKTI